jgi:GT2 family glycosyltransferase
MSVRNGAPYVREAVESILNQTMRDFEFVIVDDGSTDATRDIIKSYRDERIVLIERAHAGLADSLNAGISRARASLICRMDADDVSLPHRLETQLHCISHDPGVAVLGAGCTYTNKDGTPLGTQEVSCEHEPLLRNILNARAKGIILHPTVMMRKEAFCRAGGYRDRFAVCEDVDLWLRISELGRLRIISDRCLLYRMHGERVSVLHRRTQLLSGILARACYRARRKGLPDPAQVNDTEWQEFRACAHAILECGGVYMADEARIAMASGVAGRRGIRRYARLLGLLAADPSLWVSAVSKARWRRSLRQVTRLAEARTVKLSPPVDVCSDMM